MPNHIINPNLANSLQRLMQETQAAERSNRARDAHGRFMSVARADAVLAGTSLAEASVSGSGTGPVTITVDMETSPGSPTGRLTGGPILGRNHQPNRLVFTPNNSSDWVLRHMAVEAQEIRNVNNANDYAHFMNAMSRLPDVTGLLRREPVAIREPVAVREPATPMLALWKSASSGTRLVKLSNFMKMQMVPTGKMVRAPFSFYMQEAVNPDQYLPLRRAAVEKYGRLRMALKEAGARIADAVRHDDDDELVEALNLLPPQMRAAILDRIQGSTGGFDCVMICDSCGEAATDDDSVHSNHMDQTFCSQCSNRMVYSEFMEDYILESRQREYYESASAYHNSNSDPIDPTATACRHLVEYNGDYFSSEAYDELDFHEDDDEDDDDDRSEDTSIIGSYHSSRRRVGHMPSSYDHRKSRVLIGLELEMEVNTRHSRFDYAAKVLALLNSEHPNYCAAESDGSINHGFEIVTGHTGLDVHARVLKALDGASFGGNLSSHNTKTCGLHCHLDKADMSPLDGAKMIAFIHSPENKALIKTIARRYGGENGSHSYAKFDYGKGKAVKGGAEAMRHEKSLLQYGDYDKVRSRQMGLSSLHGDRYEAINFLNEKTVEFRLFKGTLKYTTIMACLEFAFATWHFCRQSGLTELTDEKFCQFLARKENRRDTKFLRAYLQEKGHKPMLDVEPIRLKKAAPTAEPVPVAAVTDDDAVVVPVPVTTTADVAQVTATGVASESIGYAVAA